MVKGTFLSNAKYYASLGWPVFPLAARSKRPMRDFPWLSWATTILDDVERFWDESPDSNVGVVCSNITVLDIDPRNGGMESIAYLRDRGFCMPETAVSATCSGGFHYVLKLPSFNWRLQSNPWPGIDLLARRHYFVAPPSIIPGGDYRWVRGRAPWQIKVAPVPDWLLREATMPDLAVPDCTNADVTQSDIMTAIRYSEKIPKAVSGNHGHTATFVAAKKMCTVFRHFTDDQIFQAMSWWNQLCDPPWSDDELMRKIKEARK